VEAFLKGLVDSFKVAPKCVERIQYCFDYSVLEDCFDPSFARFNLNEKTSDKCHYFLFWNDQEKGPVMQYKLYRYSDLLYPRKFMECQEHNFEGYGLGKIISTKPIKDPLSKEKFWDTEVLFKNEDGTEQTQFFKRPAYLDAIQLFDTTEHSLPTETNFMLADLFSKFDDNKRKELISNIAMMTEKCQLAEEEKTSWHNLLQSIPLKPTDILDIEPFRLPDKQSICCFRQHETQKLPIDSGIRQVDVVVHSKFSSRSRQKTIKAQEQDSKTESKLQALKKGDFVVLQVGVTNCIAYTFNFVIAQVVEDVSGKDTTDPDTLILFQVFRPTTLNNLGSKMIPWIGDTNQQWKEEFERGHVKALVELQPQGRKLTANSKKLIENAFF
jgi:hypothetical protein